MNTKIADLIVDIYRHIQAVKTALKSPPFNQSELLIQSGNVLDALMNQALAMPTNDLIVQKISELQKYVEEFNHINSTLITPDFQKNLTSLLDSLIEDLTQLKQLL